MTEKVPGPASFFAFASAASAAASDSSSVHAPSAAAPSAAGADVARLALAARDPRFHFEPTLSRPDADWAGRVGYVQHHLPAMLAAAPESDAYVCGLNAMVREARKAAKQEAAKAAGYNPGRSKNHEGADEVMMVVEVKVVRQLRQRAEVGGNLTKVFATVLKLQLEGAHGARVEGEGAHARRAAGLHFIRPRRADDLPLFLRLGRRVGAGTRRGVG